MVIDFVALDQVLVVAHVRAPGAPLWPSAHPGVGVAAWDKRRLAHTEHRLPAISKRHHDYLFLFLHLVPNTLSQRATDSIKAPARFAYAILTVPPFIYMSYSSNDNVSSIVCVIPDA